MKILIPILLLLQSSRVEVFRKEAPVLQRAADQAIAEVPGVSVLQSAKAALIEDYGVLITLEVALEPPRNPFSAGAVDRAALPQKQRQVRDRMRQFLAQKAAGVQSAEPMQTVVVVVHLFNANPVDAPNLPRQMIFTVKKQDPANVSVREF
jgi:hypothetical protein